MTSPPGPSRPSSRPWRSSSVRWSAGSTTPLTPLNDARFRVGPADLREGVSEEDRGQYETVIGDLTARLSGVPHRRERDDQAGAGSAVHADQGRVLPPGTRDPCPLPGLPQRDPNPRDGGLGPGPGRVRRPCGNPEPPVHRELPELPRRVGGKQLLHLLPRLPPRQVAVVQPAALQARWLSPRPDCCAAPASSQA